FGGIGKNFANPAITARIIMLLAFPTTMTTWTAAKALIGGVDAVSSATPLALISTNPEAMPSTLQLFIGQCGGSLGETSALALIIGFIILIATGVITWHTPVVYVATVFVFSWILGENPVQHILSGGLMLGAIFMATDYSSTPSTNWGRVIFGFGAGILTTLIRIYANYPEGVSFSILLMNILTPHISNWTRSKPMGMIIEGKGDK
ncbi:MAG: RnfABCDGE type electron transport complex subunit D, partial [Oscillospiraceae bacterium]|nr:RnfABCDGE type electron transport complex subunit D [Oscillospiraceae bacterium]